MSARSGTAADPLPVLFLVAHLETGGAERQLAALVTRMDRARFRPLVVCLKGGGPFSDEIRAAGLEVIHLGLSHGADPRFALRLAGLCRRHRIRAAIFREFSPGVVGRLVRKALGIRPLIMVEHATGSVAPPGAKRAVWRLLAPLTDGIIAVAKGQIPYLLEEKGYRPKRIRVVYNGIDLSEWEPAEPSPELARELGIPEGAPVVGIVAMLRPEKDHAGFLRAARIVAQRKPEARFLVVGDGSERPRLEALATELGIADRVIFTGRRGDVPALLSLMDVVVLSSYTIETFPLAFLEAMALERPLVGTRVGGVPEMIDEGKNGFVVPPRDPAALAGALLRVVADRETARRMGRESRRIVAERFTVERMVRDTERYLDSFFPDRSDDPGPADRR